MFEITLPVIALTISDHRAVVDVCTRIPESRRDLGCWLQVNLWNVYDACNTKPKLLFCPESGTNMHCDVTDNNRAKQMREIEMKEICPGRAKGSYPLAG